MDEMLAAARQVLAAQPFSQLLGAELARFAPGEAEIQIAIRPELLQQHGYVHGGVLSYAADNALTFAGGSALGPAVVTAGMTISYIRPARGELLIARASVIASTGRSATCRCEVWARQGGEEQLCAAAQGTVSAIGERRGQP